MLKLKRAYEPASRADGQRFFVERLWPRGVRKIDLHLNRWLKDVAPSAELRKWFSHDPEKWPEFQKRYRTELQRNPAAYAPILEAARRGTVTLVYGSRDSEHNSALLLREFLAGKLGHKASSHRDSAA